MNKVRSKDSKGFSGRNRKFKRFLQVISKNKIKVFSKFARDFPAENRWSPKKKKRFSTNLQEIFRPKSEIQAVFPAENGWSLKKRKKGLHPKNVMISGVSPQKSPIWASICTPVAPSLLISSGHSPRLGGHKQSFGGSTAWYAPRGAGSATLHHRHQMMYYFCSSCIGCIIHIIIDHSAHHNEVYYEARL